MTSAILQNKDTDAAELLRRLFAELGVSNDGTVSYLRYKAFDRIIPIFQSCFDHHKILTRSEQLHLLKRAVIEHRRTDKSADLARFMEILGKAERKILKVLPEKFFLITLVSFPREKITKLFKFKIDNVYISISRDFPASLNVQPFYFGGFGDIDPNEPRHLACLTAATTAKSRHQAAEAIFRTLDLFLGLVNFGILSGMIITKTGRIVPKAEILLGPNQVIYSADKSPFKDEIWYQPIKYDYRSGYSPIQNFSEFFLSVKLQIKKISNSNFEEILKRSISRYYSATAKIDRHDMLIEFWGILEILTGSEKSPADVAIKRATSLSSDPWLRQRSLERASMARNRYVHVGTQDSAIEDVVDELKNYVEQMIKFLMSNKFKLKSFEEFCRFLDLPSNKKALNDQVRIRKLKRQMLTAS